MSQPPGAPLAPMNGSTSDATVWVKEDTSRHPVATEGSRMDIGTGFERAGLRAERSWSPLASGPAAKQIFGMTIDERDSTDEVFRYWPGEENHVIVRDAKPGRHQMVVDVWEPVREFQQVWVVADDADLESRLERANGRVLQREAHWVKVALTTPAHERHFLLGTDETHYFIAQLPREASSVEDAHDVLRPLVARAPGTLRQGEWFFIPVSDEQQYGAWPEGTTLKDEPIARTGIGTPHVASEVFIRRDASGETFARGVVTQAPRHRPLVLGDRWHRVVRNLEIAAPDWMDWVD